MILLLLVASAVAASPASARTTTPELRAKLRNSRRALRDSRARLAKARENLAAARVILAVFSVATIDDLVEGDVVDADATDPTDAVDPTVAVDPTDAADPTAAVDPTVEADPVTAEIVPTLAEVEALEARVAKTRLSTRGWRRRVDDLARIVRRRERIAEWARRGAWRPLIELAARTNGISAGGLYRMMLYESGGSRFAGSTYKGLFQYLPSTWQASWNPFRGASVYDGWAQIRATAYAIKRGYGPSMWPSTYPRAF